MHTPQLSVRDKSIRHRCVTWKNRVRYIVATHLTQRNKAYRRICMYQLYITQIHIRYRKGKVSNPTRRSMISKRILCSCKYVIRNEDKKDGKSKLNEMFIRIVVVVSLIHFCTNDKKNSKEIATVSLYSSFYILHDVCTRRYIRYYV